MVRALLEGIYLSDPETASCQMDADSLCSGPSRWSNERNGMEERACRETCVAQQGASMNVFQPKCLFVWVKGTWLITALYEIGLVVFCRHFHFMDSFFSSLLWLELLSWVTLIRMPFSSWLCIRRSCEVSSVVLSTWVLAHRRKRKPRAAKLQFPWARC